MAKVIAMVPPPPKLPVPDLTRFHQFLAFLQYFPTVSQIPLPGGHGQIIMRYTKDNQPRFQFNRTYHASPSMAQSEVTSCPHKAQHILRLWADECGTLEYQEKKEIADYIEHIGV